MSGTGRSVAYDAIVMSEKVWDLRHKHGMVQTRIAKELNISVGDVSRHLKKATEAYTAKFLEDVTQVKNEQVIQLEHVAGEAMSAWHRSKEAKIKKKGLFGKDGVKRGSKEEQEQYGDPRYLTEYRKCKEDIRKILGVGFLPNNDEKDTVSSITIKVIDGGKETIIEGSGDKPDEAAEGTANA